MKHAEKADTLAALPGYFISREQHEGCCVMTDIGNTVWEILVPDIENISIVWESHSANTGRNPPILICPLLESLFKEYISCNIY